MTTQAPALKSQDANTSSAAPSSLAFGLNLGTAIGIQNHWREYYNPLRALDLPRAIALYDFSRRGLFAELQNCYREMEQLYPTLIGLLERRISPLLEMQFDWKTPRKENLPPGATEMMADDQGAALRDSWGKIDNRYEAVEWLEMAAFRGYSHLEKIYANPGTSDLTISHLEPVEQWHWTRKSMYSEWEYNPSATQTNVGIPIDYDQFVIREVSRPIDRVALILWIRANLCEKDWDAFIEIYGIPHWIVIMPPNVPPEKETEYLSAARIIAQGGSGALPGGSTAICAASGTDAEKVFRPRLDWIQEQLVLAGTGGMLAMLSSPTGMSDSQGTQHADAFAQIATKEAVLISKVIQRQFDRYILDNEFPGLPRLAKTVLDHKAQADTGAFVSDVLKLSQSGWQVSPQQITEKTGCQVTIRSTAGNPPTPKL